MAKKTQKPVPQPTAEQQADANAFVKDAIAKAAGDRKVAEATAAPEAQKAKAEKAKPVKKSAARGKPARKVAAKKPAKAAKKPAAKKPAKGGGKTEIAVKMLLQKGGALRKEIVDACGGWNVDVNQLGTRKGIEVTVIREEGGVRYIGKQL